MKLVENRGRDVSALLIGGRGIVERYDLICFAHDKKSTQTPPLIIGQSFAYKCFENILSSPDFVCNVVRTFEENPRLGVLSPPPPNHSVFFPTIGNEWGMNFDNTVKLAALLNLRVDIDESKAPVAPFGTMFWFRPAALQKLIDHDWAYGDFPAEPTGDIDGNITHTIERIYPFVAQAAGFYSGWLLSDQFAGMEITNLNYIMYINRMKSDEKNEYVSKLKPQFEAMEGYIAELQARLGEKYHKEAMLSAELAEVYNSKSWRLTKPLRMLFSVVRQFCKKLG